MEIVQKNLKQCEICKDDDATGLCSQCFKYYCDKCYKFVHESKKNKEHKKEVIDFNVSIDTHCPDHERNPLNLFCLEEKSKIYSYIFIYSPLLCILLLYEFA